MLVQKNEKKLGSGELDLRFTYTQNTEQGLSYFLNKKLGCLCQDTDG